jgi:hypothetical protein
MGIGLVVRGGLATQQVCQVEEGVAFLYERWLVGGAMVLRNR